MAKEIKEMRIFYVSVKTDNKLRKEALEKKKSHSAIAEKYFMIGFNKVHKK